MIKAVIFDCFGVLTDDPWLAFCDSLPPGKDVKRARELNHQYDAGVITQDEFLSEVYKATGHKPEEVVELLGSDRQKNTPLLRYIRTLKPNYKTGMISNIATNWIRDYFLTADEQELFDAFVFSFEVGTTKPDPLIYEIAVKKLGVNSSECVFIDDIPRYAEAAKGIGMQGIAYKNFGQMQRELEALLG